MLLTKAGFLSGSGHISPVLTNSQPVNYRPSDTGYPLGGGCWHDGIMQPTGARVEPQYSLLKRYPR